MKTNKVYKRGIFNTRNSFYAGENISQKMQRVTQTNEAIENTCPIIYTERKDGVLPEYDIRTDKWEIAQKAMNFVSQKKREKRQEFLEKLGYKFDENGKFIKQEVSDNTEPAE